MFRAIVFDKAGYAIGEVDATRAARSWSLGDIGECDLVVPIRSSSITWDILRPGNHLGIVSDQTSLWAGIISAPLLGYSFDNDEVVIVCRSAEAHLMGRLMDVSSLFADQRADDIVKAIVQRLSTVYGVPIDLGQIDVGGEGGSITQEYHLDEMIGVIRGLSSARGFEYWVEPYITPYGQLRFRFHWMAARGRDLSNEVALTAGLHTGLDLSLQAVGQIATHIWGHLETNRWWGVPGGLLQSTDEGAASVFGRWDLVIGEEGGNTQGLAVATRQQLMAHNHISWQLMVPVLNVDSMWARFAEGDIVRFTSLREGLSEKGRGLDVRMRVQGRSLDETKGIMVVDATLIAPDLPIGAMLYMLEEAGLRPMAQWRLSNVGA